MTTTYNLEMHAGETKWLEVTVADQYSVPVNLTGADITYIAQLPVPIEKTVGNGITLTDPTAGVFEIAIGEDDTVGIERTISVEHECKVATATGEVMVAFAGRLTVRDSLIGDMVEG